MNIKPCPFCGWAGAKVQKRGKDRRWMESLVAEIRVDKSSYYVVCNRCKARGAVVTGWTVGACRRFDSFDPIGEPTKNVPQPDWTTTPEKLECKAVEAWNRRAE